MNFIPTHMEFQEIIYYGLIGFLVITALFLVKRYWKYLTSCGEVESFENLKSYGDSAFKHRDYIAALGYYYRCKTLAINDQQIIASCNSIAKCYIWNKSYHDALVYLDISTSLDIYSNHEALRLKSDCLSYMKKDKESLLELFLLEHISKDDSLSDVIKRKRHEYIMVSSDEYIKGKILPTSRITYKQILSTLVGVFPPNRKSEVKKIIKAEDFEKLDDYLFNSSEHRNLIVKEERIFVNVLYSLLCFSKGFCYDIWKIYENRSSDLERLMYAYFRLLYPFVGRNQGYQRILSKPFVLQSDSPTVIFYLAKCNLLLGKKEKYFELLSKIKEYPFVYLELLDYYKNNETDKFEDISEEAINKFPGDMDILTSIAGELKEAERYEDLKSLINKMDISDPRTSYYKSEIAEYFNDTISREEHLRRACQLDSTLFIAYFTLVCIEVNKIEDKEYNPNDYKEIRKLFLKAISKAGDYRLVYHCQTALLDLDMTDYIHTKIREVPRK